MHSYNVRLCYVGIDTFSDSPATCEFRWVLIHQLVSKVSHGCWLHLSLFHDIICYENYLAMQMVWYGSSFELTLTSHNSFFFLHIHSRVITLHLEFYCIRTFGYTYWNQRQLVVVPVYKFSFQIDFLRIKVSLYSNSYRSTTTHFMVGFFDDLNANEFVAGAVFVIAVRLWLLFNIF